MKQRYATVGDLPDSLEGTWTTRDASGEEAFLGLAEGIEQYGAALVCFMGDDEIRVFAIVGTVPYLSKLVTELVPLV